MSNWGLALWTALGLAVMIGMFVFTYVVGLVLS